MTQKKCYNGVATVVYGCNIPEFRHRRHSLGTFFMWHFKACGWFAVVWKLTAEISHNFFSK